LSLVLGFPALETREPASMEIDAGVAGRPHCGKASHVPKQPKIQPLLLSVNRNIIRVSDQPSCAALPVA
jgi:hypothetical protein